MVTVNTPPDMGREWVAALKLAFLIFLMNTVIRYLSNLTYNFLRRSGHWLCHFCPPNYCQPLLFLPSHPLTFCCGIMIKSFFLLTSPDSTHSQAHIHITVSKPVRSPSFLIPLHLSPFPITPLSVYCNSSRRIHVSSLFPAFCQSKSDILNEQCQWFPMVFKVMFKIPISVFPSWGSFIPRGHLIMSEAILVVQPGVEATGIWWGVGARDAAKHLTMHRTISPPKRLIWNKMSLVLRLRNRAFASHRKLFLIWSCPSLPTHLLLSHPKPLCSSHKELLGCTNEIASIWQFWPKKPQQFYNFMIQPNVCRFLGATVFLMSKMQSSHCFFLLIFQNPDQVPHS